MPQNNKEDLQWNHKAAKQGQADAQFNIELMYCDGEGVPKNYKEALRWCHKAAKQGDAHAEFSIDVIHEKNYKEALKWFYKAGKQLPSRGTVHDWVHAEARKHFSRSTRL